MKKVYMYAHGGSGNHGCEAIVRSTAKILKGMGYNNLNLISSDPTEDMKYGIGQICNILKDKEPYSKFSLDFVKAYINLKTKKDFTYMDQLDYMRTVSEINPGDIALSIGGDNYCYADVKKYVMLHNMMLKRGAQTVLWGCSVELDVVEEKKIAEDLKRYNLIVARESITYEAIKKVNPNTVLCPDPAFFMKPQACDVDSRFESGNVIGINLSPMIISNEKNDGITLKNYKNLVDYILENTDSYIALIPHVVWASNDDRKALQELYDLCENKERIILVEDHTAPELKYIISKCRIFIGARTHSTIAAYSSGVPTLVVGYSVKAKGIARDLFGTEENYVLPVQALQNENDLLNAFTWIQNKEDEIRTHLENFLPDYFARGKNAKESLKSLIE